MTMPLLVGVGLCPIFIPLANIKVAKVAPSSPPVAGLLLGLRLATGDFGCLAPDKWMPHDIGNDQNHLILLYYV